MARVQVAMSLLDLLCRSGEGAFRVDMGTCEEAPIESMSASGDLRWLHERSYLPNSACLRVRSGHTTAEAAGLLAARNAPCVHMRNMRDFMHGPLHMTGVGSGGARCNCSQISSSGTVSSSSSSSFARAFRSAAQRRPAFNAFSPMTLMQ